MYVRHRVFQFSLLLLFYVYAIDRSAETMAIVLRLLWETDDQIMFIWDCWVAELYPTKKLQNSDRQQAKYPYCSNRTLTKCYFLSTVHV
jgi:hypothetical protein